MADLTNYLIAHKLVAVGLGILVWLVLHNVRRGQPRIAIGMALVICVALFYVYRQILVDKTADGAVIDPTAVEALPPPVPDDPPAVQPVDPPATR